jgi:hypothetical protein
MHSLVPLNVFLLIKKNYPQFVTLEGGIKELYKGTYFFFFFFKLRASLLLGRYSTLEPHPALFCFSHFTDRSYTCV